MPIKHGYRPAGDMSPTYRSWVSMRQRCNNPEATGFSRYGGRGISVCKRWDDFEAFLRDMGPRPDGTTIDRKDPDGNYEPGNCRWSTPQEQSRNRANSVFININGEERLAVEVAAELGIPHGKMLRRISEGRNINDILSGKSLLNQRSGDRCPASKLRSKDVAKIKRMLLDGTSCAEVARIYGRSYMCIKDIQKGKNWKSTEPEENQ